MEGKPFVFVAICSDEKETLTEFLKTNPMPCEVDPKYWTKKGHSLATFLPAFLTGNSC